MYIKEMMKGSWMQEYESSYLIQQAVTLARLRSDPAHPCMLKARTQAHTHIPIACNGYIVLSGSLCGVRGVRDWRQCRRVAVNCPWHVAAVEHGSGERW